MNKTITTILGFIVGLLIIVAIRFGVNSFLLRNEAGVDLVGKSFSIQIPETNSQVTLKIINVTRVVKNDEGYFANVIVDVEIKKDPQTISNTRRDAFSGDLSINLVKGDVSRKLPSELIFDKWHVLIHYSGNVKIE